MALSLAACGGSSTTTAVTPVVDTPVVDTPVVDTPVVDAATSQAFTANLDTLKGGSGDDTFNGVHYADGGTGTTAFPGDSVDGGAGTDTLNISVAGLSTADQPINAITTVSVEKVFVSNYDTNLTDTEDTQVDTSLMTGITTIGLTSSSATGDTEFTNVKNILAAEMRNGSGDLTISYLADAIKGTADAATVTVSNLTAGALVSNGIETITIDSELAKSTITTLTSDKLTKLVVTGDQNLTITDAVDFVAGTNDDTTIDATIDASAFTGKLNVTADQNDTSITGGSGDDTINMVALLTKNDAIDGGAGNDTLTMNEAALTTQLDGVSNIETVSFNANASSSAAVTLDASKLGSAVKTIKFDADDNGAAGKDHTVSNITDQAIVIGNAVDNAADGNTKVTLTNKTDTAADTLSVSVVEIIEDSDETDIDVLTAANFETVNLESTKLAATTGSIINNIDSLAIASATTLNITGNSELVIDGITGGAMTALDASGLAAKLTATFSSTDKVTATAASKDTTFNFGSTLDNNDTVVGGASAKDVVTATLSGATATTGALNISGVETVTLTTSAANTIDLTKVVGATTVSVSGNTQTITGLNVATTALESTGNTTAKVTASDATGAADVLTYGVKVNADSSNTVEASDIETLAITLNDTAAGTDHTATFDVDAFKGANITVADVATTTDDMNVALGTLNAAIRSVDTTGVDGTQSASAASATAGVSFALAGDAAATITGSDYADTFTIASTTAGHSITGGTGADTATITTKGDTNLSSIDVETLNVVVAAGTDVSVTNFHSGVDDVVVTGGNSLSTLTSGTLNTALKSVDASAFGGNVVLTLGDDTADNTVTLKGGASTKDSLTFQLSDTDFGATTTGIEKFIANVDADVDVINLTTTTGVTAVEVDVADSITAIVSGMTTQTVTVTDGAGDSQIEVKLASSTGNSDAVTVELKDAGTDIDAGFNIKATDIETVTVKASSAESVDLSNLSMATASAVMSVAATGDKALTVSALNADVTTVDASGMAEGGSFVQTGRSATTASTYTGSDGNDTFILAHGGDVIAAGAGTGDTLDVDKAAILGGVNVDLSSATDQLVSFNGSAGAGTVTGFENVDLSGYTGSFGGEVTGSTGANKVTGTANADQVSLGAGDDIYVLSDMTDDTVDAGAGTADALAMVAGVDVAVTDDMGTYTNFEKLTADAASTTVYSFTAKADFKSDTGISTIDFSADTNSTGDNVIDLGAIDATMTVIGSSGKDTVSLSDEDFDMTVTGGAGNDVLISTAAANTDTFVFASTGALNGLDTITGVVGAGKDKFDVSAFLSGGTFNSTDVAVAATGDIAIDNKVVMLSATAEADVDEIAEVAALIEGTGDALSLASGGKGIVITGDATGANDIANIYFVDDTVGATAGTISADDVVKVATFSTFGGVVVDLDTMVAGNFVF